MVTENIVNWNGKDYIKLLYILKIQVGNYLSSI